MMGMNMLNMMTKIFTLPLLIISLNVGFTESAFAADDNAALDNKIESIDFSALSGGRVSIRLLMK